MSWKKTKSLESRGEKVQIPSEKLKRILKKKKKVRGGAARETVDEKRKLKEGV